MILFSGDRDRQNAIFSIGVC